MIIYPAIDMYEGKAVRLFKGDYKQMTVYNDDPNAVADDFVRQGASCIHIVDLEGAKSGKTPNLDRIVSIKSQSGLFCEVGGGIRTMQIADRYLSAGLDRVILGTAAVTDPTFAAEAVKAFGDAVAVGVDIRDGYVAIKGWTESSKEKASDFCKKMRDIGVKTIICTDISRDGAMRGSNHQLYKMLSDEIDIQIIASGGVSSLEDVKSLRRMNLHGAIVGKAYYTGAVNLAQAIEVAK